MSKQVFELDDVSQQCCAIRNDSTNIVPVKRCTNNAPIIVTPLASSFRRTVKRIGDSDKPLVYTTTISGQHPVYADKNYKYNNNSQNHRKNNNNNNSGLLVCHHRVSCYCDNGALSPATGATSAEEEEFYLYCSNSTSAAHSFVDKNRSISDSNYSLLSDLIDRFARFRLRMPNGVSVGSIRPIIYKKTRRIPVSSIIALLVSWIGLALFCTKTYNGAVEIENLSQGLFAFLIPWIEKFKTGLIILGIFMACVTFIMAVVGFMATQYCHCSYKDKPHSCLCSNFGGRITCALFWIFSYLLNLCWLGILSATVVMTAAYLAFSPICLPQAGNEANFCFNFTLFSLMISGGKDSNAVSLILCGGPIDKFCRLTKGIMPFFWGSYFGCIAVLLGLSHFNASLAANFAHGKHALRYRKLRKVKGSPSTLYKSQQWTPPAKSVFYDEMDNTIPQSTKLPKFPPDIQTLKLEADIDSARKPNFCCHHNDAVCNGTLKSQNDVSL